MEQAPRGFTPQAFERALAGEIRTARVRNPVRLFEGVRLGEAPPEALRIWAGQFYHLFRALPDLMETLAQRCPAGALRDYFDDMVSMERGDGRPEKSHLPLFKKFTRALGVSDEALEATPPYPAIRDLLDYLERLCRKGDALEAVAAIGIVLEGKMVQRNAGEMQARGIRLLAQFVKRLMGRETKGDELLGVCRQQYGLRDEDLEFFFVHRNDARRQNYLSWELVVTHARTAEEQERVRLAVSHTCELYHEIAREIATAAGASHTSHAFEQVLREEIRTARSRHMVRLFEKIRRGEVPPEALRLWTGQFYHLFKALPVYLETLAAGCSSAEIRAHLLENLAEERGNGRPERAHLVLYKKFTRALGLPDEGLEATSPNTATKDLLDYLDGLCREASPLEALAALGIVLEGEFAQGRGTGRGPLGLRRIARHAGEALGWKRGGGLIGLCRERYGLTDDALEFLLLHQEADKRHSRLAWDLVMAHARTRSQQEGILLAIRQTYALYFGAMRQILVDAQAGKGSLVPVVGQATAPALGGDGAPPYEEPAPLP